MPRPQYPPTVFVLGTRQHVGKTVTSMGVIAKLLSPEYGYSVDEIGYIKPVGQQAVTVQGENGKDLRVDKDVVLVTELLGIDMPRYEVTSPVIWEGGLTASYIDDQCSDDPQIDPQYFREKIKRSYQEIAAGKKMVIVEGTGQPGVGSIGGISNPEVINLLREMGVPLYVLMVTNAGIGSTIDRTFPYMITMDHLGAKVDGIIINKVFPSKKDKIEDYLTRYYTQLFPKQYGHLMSQPMPPLVGFIPLVPQLRMFSMRLLAQMFNKEDPGIVEILAPDDFDELSGRLITNLKTINLRFGYERFVEPGDAIIVGVNANDIVLSALLLHERYKRLHGKGLGGLIFTCSQIGGLSSHVMKLVKDEGIPTIAVEYDSAETITLIDGWTVKVQPYDVEKRELIARTYCDYLDLAQILEPRGEGELV